MKKLLSLVFFFATISVHDSQTLDNLLDEKDTDQDLYADSAYTGEEQEKIISNTT